MRSQFHHTDLTDANHQRCEAQGGITITRDDGRRYVIETGGDRLVNGLWRHAVRPLEAEGAEPPC